MKRNLLQKCLDELLKPEPKLDYIRGILETLTEMEPEEPAKISLHPPTLGVRNVAPPQAKDEGDVLDAMARAAMATMPPLQTE